MINTETTQAAQGSRSLNRMLADFPEGTYQERCVSCKKLFWGRKDASECSTCSKKSDEWWDALTDEQQLAHMRSMIAGINAAKANAVVTNGRDD